MIPEFAKEKCLEETAKELNVWDHEVLADNMRSSKEWKSSTIEMGWLHLNKLIMATNAAQLEWASEE